MKTSGFVPQSRKEPIPKLKKVLQFFQKLGSAILSRLRVFAWRKLIPWGALLLGSCLFFCACALTISAAVCHKTAPRITTAEALQAAGEHFDLILVLGCAVRPDGTPSHMLEDRIKTGVSLYGAGLADGILMSGDRSEGYDEVGTMHRVAEELGVPQEVITIDPEGYSTYESMVNLLKAHKGKRVLIVTQKYHLYRALYIAQKLGIDAWGVSADLRTYTKQLKYDLREILARIKDVFLVEYNSK